MNLKLKYYGLSPICAAAIFVAQPARRNHGTPGSPATTTISGKDLPPPPGFAAIEEALGFKPRWPPGRAAQGRAERAAHHDG
jgi:hypothetical protein